MRASAHCVLHKKMLRTKILCYRTIKKPIYFSSLSSTRFLSANLNAETKKIEETKSPREILGLKIGENDPKQIKTAYFRKARQFHPDTYSNMKIDPAEVEYRKSQFTLVTRAYESLLIEPDLYSLLGLEKDIDLGSSANLNILMNHYAQRLQMLQGDFKMEDREARIHDLQYAFDVLSDPVLRRKYNDGFTDLREELKKIAQEHNIDLRMSVPKMGVKGYSLYYLQWFGIVTVLVGLGFYFDSIRNLGVQNPDRYNIVTEENYDEKMKKQSS